MGEARGRPPGAHPGSGWRRLGKPESLYPRVLVNWSWERRIPGIREEKSGRLGGLEGGVTLGNKRKES